LSKETPAHLVAFDLLSDEKGEPIMENALLIRRQGLENMAKRYFKKHSLLQLSPATTDLSKARAWLRRPGLFLDGIIAKRLDLAYIQGKRTVMQKFKNIRTADCVVGGFRYAAKSRVVGSLLLGLFEDGLSSSKTPSNPAKTSSSWVRISINCGRYPPPA
jgi:ATP-dependent DNA ligase